jgi:hypothetical protein
MSYIENEFVDNKEQYEYMNAYVYTYTDSINSDLPTTFNINFANPILDKSNNYAISIQSVSLFNQTIPFFTWDDNFYVGVKHNASGDLFQRQCTYIPSGYSYDGKNNPSIGPNIGPSYPVYDMDQICQSFNIAIGLAVSACNTDKGTTLEAPTLVFDGNSGLFRLWAEIASFEGGTGVAQIVVNTNFMNLLFYAFRSYTLFSETFTSGFTNDYVNVILVQPSYNNRYNGDYDAPTSNLVGTHRFMSQDYQTSSTIFRNTSIRVCLYDNSIRPEKFNVQIDQNSTIQPPSDKILIDLYTNPLNFSSISGKTVYYPQYTAWHNLDTSKPFQRMNISINYIDQTGTQYPVYLPRGYLSAVRLIFKKIY